MEILSQHTPLQELQIFMFALKVWVSLYELIPEYESAAYVYQTTEAWDYVDLSIKRQEGRRTDKRIVELDRKILIVEENPDNPAAGCYLMKYGWYDEIKAILYWTTKMQTIYFNQERKHDTSKTS